MKKVAALAITFIFMLSLFVIAGTRSVVPTVYLATTFNFAHHPACSSSKLTDCVKGVRFYDADSHLSLAEVEAGENMTGQQSIVGVAQVSSIPHRIYAVTVYRDHAGRLNEGRPGQISESTNYARR